MKAELKSGEIITLAKECECVTHNDPHWIYMDRLDHERNRWPLTQPQPTFLGLIGMASEEVTRLAEKRRNFERLGIVRVIPEASDELTEVQRERNRRFAESYAKEVQARIDAQTPKPAVTPGEARRERRNRKEEVEIEARRTL